MSVRRQDHPSVPELFVGVGIESARIRTWSMGVSLKNKELLFEILPVHGVSCAEKAHPLSDDEGRNVRSNNKHHAWSIARPPVLSIPLLRFNPPQTTSHVQCTRRQATMCSMRSSARPSRHAIVAVAEKRRRERHVLYSFCDLYAPAWHSVMPGKLGPLPHRFWPHLRCWRGILSAAV